MRIPPVRRLLLAIGPALLLAGCANGDFGEVQDYLVTDRIHDWVGRDTVPAPSAFPYTDDERLLRDLAYPLIEPPHDRQRWYSIAGEYGLREPSLRNDRIAYANHLMSAHFRSPSSRYAQLIDDIRNDSTRMAPFFEVAGRVIDIDVKRRKSLRFVSPVSGEPENALVRNRENANVVAIVRTSIAQRAAAYRFALERLVIEVPSPQAIEAERSLGYLKAQVAYYQRHLAPTWQREKSLASTN
ncbi:MAG: hypothetical protein ACK4UO_05415 [Pseudolabrys sp.]